MSSSGVQKTHKHGKSKVRSGCRTCKARRVKCDEQRPVCQKCLSTGRVCEGYGIWGGGGNAYGSQLRKTNVEACCSLPLMLPRSLLGSAKPEEETCFDFFRLRTAIKLPGVFECTFWEQLIFQLSATEPAVLHAAVALASLQRSQWLQDSCHNDGRRTNHVDIADSAAKWHFFALQQYNKAIAHLRSHFEARDRKSLQIALTTCILFTCIELLRKEYNTANIHLESGINLLCAVQGQRQPNPHSREKGRHTLSLSTEPRSVDDHITEAFTRLNMQSVLFGFPSRYLYIVAKSACSESQLGVPGSFMSLYEARRYLDGIWSAIFQFSDTCNVSNTGSDTNSYKYEGGLDRSSLLDHQRNLHNSLCAWITAFNASIANFTRYLNPRTGMGVPLLRVYYTMLEIILSTCLNQGQSGHEMIYDNYTHLFTFMVNQMENLITFKDLPISIPAGIPPCELVETNFIADMGMISPLYYTALKCRVPAIRRRAINALQVASHQEVMYVPAFITAAVKRIVTLEEGDFYAQDDLRDSSTGHRYESGEVTLPDAYRFHDVKLGFSREERTKGKLICRRKASPGDGWDITEESFEY